MKEYIASAVAVCAVCAVVNMLSLDGRTEKQVSFVLSLCVVGVLCSPVVSSFSGIGEAAESFISELRSADDGGVTILGEEAANIGVEELICREFGVKGENIEADSSVEIIGDSVVFNSVKIYLSGLGSLANIPEIEKYIEKTLGCECEVNLVEA